MSTADLAAVAAFTAAGLSLINVVITVRLVRRGQRERWRREQERPIVARCLTLSSDIRHEWHEASVARQDARSWALPEAQQRIRKGWEALRDLHYEATQLDLLANHAVRQAARELVAAHDKEMNRLTFPPRPDTSENAARRASQGAIGELEVTLVERARVDLGLSSAQPTGKPRSLIGQHGARQKEGSLRAGSP